MLEEMPLLTAKQGVVASSTSGTAIPLARLGGPPRITGPPASFAEFLGKSSMRSIIVVLCVFVVCFKAGWLVAEDSTAASSTTVTLQRSACQCCQCYVAETPNFRVHCCTSPDRLRELAESCERLKARCQTMWLGETSTSWQSRCEVVVHSSVGTYCRTLGPGSERTSGCSTVRLDKGRVAERRIDLRSDAEGWLSETLPHELTHVVLADRFTERRIPAWADEGIAMLAESPDKLQRRLNELRGVVAAGRTLGLRQLVSLENGPTSESRAAFYGQSVTLAGLLLERGTPQQLIQFVEAGQRDGHDIALRDVYGVESWSTLESEWRSFAASQRLRKLAQHSLPEAKPDQRVSVTEKKMTVMAD